jgi:SAM-dependent methyltransferase
VNTEALREQARLYYESRLREHGTSARGVDWNSHESQELRFTQLTRVLNGDRAAGVVDYGCGYGALASYLRGHGYRGSYVGFDVSAEMIDAARRVTVGLEQCRFTCCRDAVEPADFVVGSGLFNVKQDASQPDWQQYVLNTIDDLARLSRRGFAFNALTAFSDADKMRPDLYYADPFELFEYCRRSFSRNIALLHDYGLYEFTMIVRL